MTYPSKMSTSTSTSTPTLILMAFLGLTTVVAGFSLRTLGELGSGGGSEAQSGHLKQTRSVDTSLAQPIQVCGLRLLEAVRVICRNRGGYLMTRRSDPSLSLAPLYEELEMPMSNSLMEDYQNDGVFGDSGDLGQGQDGALPSPSQTNSGDWWNLSPSKLIAFKVLTSESGSSSSKGQGQGQQHARFRRNIIDECCKRPCPRSQMVKYCVRA